MVGDRDGGRDHGANKSGRRSRKEKGGSSVPFKAMSVGSGGEMAIVRMDAVTGPPARDWHMPKREGPATCVVNCGTSEAENPNQSGGEDRRLVMTSQQREVKLVVANKLGGKMKMGSESKAPLESRTGQGERASREQE